MDDRHPQDDLLIVMALGCLEREFRDADPELAKRAWILAIEIAAEHGLTPAEAVRQLE